MIETTFLATANHLLAQAPWARERLRPHAGLVATLEIEAVRIRFAVDADGLLHGAPAQGAQDVSLRIPAQALPDFALGRFEQGMRHVHLQGNAEFADAIGFVFRNLRWDAEEDAARLIGDVAAHRLFTTLHSVDGAARQALRGLGGNLAEYLTEERPLLVGQRQVALFSADVSALRDAVSRLEKRVERLAPAPAARR